MKMAVGEIAPDFSLQDQHGESRDISSYRNRWVVLYFYPRDDTPGCTREACHFRDDYPAARKLGAEILGISVDSPESHAKFAGKYGLPFPLLADTGGNVARQYGALWSFGPIRFARRRTFIIDPQGKIEKIYRKVSSDTHSLEVIEDLRRLQEAPAGRD
jgi:peroxiredoxin Q/BCP